MGSNPFSILGVSESASQEELFIAYKAARGKYEHMRFEPGEKGAEACSRIDEIEQAYRDAKDILAAQNQKSNVFEGVVVDEFARVDNLLKEKRYQEARAILDSMSYKSAHWYYLSSIINYANGDYITARDELREAVRMEPNNEKYKFSLNRIEAKLSGQPGANRTEFYAREGTNDNNRRSYSGDGSDSGRRGCTACDVCTGILCADCCCECMGGDLISCC